MKNIIHVMIFFCGCIVVFSCKKNLPDNDTIINPPPLSVNILPYANAGLSQIIVLPADSVLLNGSSSSDPGGKIILYSWTKISGPSSFYIVSPDSSKTIVSKLVDGIYQFELNVKDNEGLTARTTVQITVNSPPPPLQPPPPPTPIPDSLGRVTFWTWLAVGDDRQASIINITIGNQKKTLTSVGGSPTSCTDKVPYLTDGQFDLTPGVYSWNATYYQYSVSGTITINRGICVLQEIIF